MTPSLTTTPLALVVEARKAFHTALLSGPLSSDEEGIISVADRGGNTSREIATQMVKRIGVAAVKRKQAGQMSGNAFEQIVAAYLRETFLKLAHLRPGDWEVVDKTTTSDSTVEISNFEQYQHLARLMNIIKSDRSLAADLGTDYLITPDVVVLRRAETDETINRPGPIVDDSVANLTSLRRANHKHEKRLLHASVSCKWTLRSDRAQNARSEALNLIRNRKGHVPHIVAVTAEPTPLRLASLALGTSDLDCVYHIALPELCAAVKLVERRKIQDQREALNMLIDGKRLRDIGDLPLDLAI